MMNPLGSMGAVAPRGCSEFAASGVWSIGCEVVSDEAELAAALALHLELGPLIDGHNDLPWAMRKYANYSMSAVDLATDHRLPGGKAVEAGGGDLQTDIPRLREGGPPPQRVRCLARPDMAARLAPQAWAGSSGQSLSRRRPTHPPVQPAQSAFSRPSSRSTLYTT